MLHALTEQRRIMIKLCTNHKTKKYNPEDLFWAKTRSSRPEVFCKKGAIRNFAKFTGKHLCQSFFFDKVAGQIHRKTPVPDLLNLAESNFQNYNHSISIRIVFDYHSISITEFDSEHLICQNIWTNNNGWERINSLLPCKKWDKVFKSGLSKFNGRQPLKNFKGYGLLMS